MKLIDKIIKILINYKYKKEPFMAWHWGIDNVHEINILTAEYYQEHYRYGTREEWYKAESERQKYFAYLDGVADGLNESRNDINSVLDKIRADVQNGIHHFLDGEPIIEIKEVLQILDKYKVESEE